MRLLALALHRLVWFVPTLLGLLVVTFVISRVVPADPVALVAGETATPSLPHNPFGRPAFFVSSVQCAPPSVVLNSPPSGPPLSMPHDVRYTCQMPA